MRIITLNVNGLRSAHAKGFTEWMRRQKPDIVCLQEIKAHESDLPRALLAPRGLHAFFHPAEKRGYSGVAMYARREPDNVVIGLGIKEIDAQGRFLQADFGNLSAVSLYMPSGTMGEAAQARKYAFMDIFMERLGQMRACGREFVICGDWNIAHREIDVKNWKSNQKMTGFLPRERNIGWRIDYQVATPGLAAKATKAVIHAKPVFSDHAPLVIDYDYAC
jgi:exodeoxyribonuclease-3